MDIRPLKQPIHLQVDLMFRFTMIPEFTPSSEFFVTLCTVELGFFAALQSLVPHQIVRAGVTAAAFAKMAFLRFSMIINCQQQDWI